MGYQKLQVGRATPMDDKLSDTEDTINLDDPINASPLTAASVVGNLITVTGATFITDGVQPGDLIVNLTTPSQATRVAAVQSQTELVTVAAAPALVATNTFNILSESTESAVLYIGTTASATNTLKVRTEGGDDVTFNNLVQGTFLPVQVRRIYATGTADVSNVLALF